MNTSIATQDNTIHAAGADQFDSERNLRNAFVKAWRADPKQNAAAHAAYAMIRGKSLDKTFSPITNPNKLACNSLNPHAGRDEACRLAQAGAKHAWGWAEEALAAAGLELDRYGRYAIKDHPLIDQWISRSISRIK